MKLLKQMKIQAFCLSLICSSLSAQTATTDPVGIITATVYGSGGLGERRLTLISSPLHANNESTGLVESISSTSVTVSTSLPVGAYDDGLYYIEIVAADGTGYWTDIISNSTNELIVNDDLTSFVAIDNTFYIRKHTTIGDLFGESNEAGLQAASNLGAADNVQILRFSGGTSTNLTYWYSDFPGFEGWYDADFNPSENAIIAPHEGIIVVRKIDEDLQIVFDGKVRVNNISFPVESSLNVLSVPSALVRTLSTSGLSSIITPGSNIAQADNIQVIDPNGQNITYWLSNFPGFEGWFDASFNPSDDVELTPGTSFIFIRKPNNGGAFNLPMVSTIPQS